MGERKAEGSPSMFSAVTMWPSASGGNQTLSGDKDQELTVGISARGDGS